jgi:agmatinase|tara:strand:+ start:9050 stop:9946 length:897 start_codon:yes stop_codon:yes gene_type:complete
MKILSPKMGFLGLSDKEFLIGRGKKKVTVVPFGIEESVTYGRGTSKGPEAIIKASHQLELFDEELCYEPYKDFNLKTLAPFTIKSGIRPALEQLEGVVSHILEDDSFPLILGGEHSLTAGAIRPFLKSGEGLSLLHIDAHADLRDRYDQKKLSHATVIRRCLDYKDVRVVSVGVRSISSQEVSFYESNNDRINIYWAKDKESWNIDEIISPLRNTQTYLSVDLDGFDISIMPATGTPEPGGMSWEEVIKIIHKASQVASNIVGADIVELAPIKGFPAYDFLAAKLAYKILGYRFFNSH